MFISAGPPLFEQNRCAERTLHQFLESLHGEKLLYFNFVVTPRNFIIAKLSIRKPGSSSVLIKSLHHL